MRALLLPALLSLIPVVPAVYESPERPSVLLIIADDLGTDVLASYGIGLDLPETPNLDALARRSVQFRNAWSAPVCSPARACLQTGRFGFRTGIGITVKNTRAYNGLSASEIILPEMLDAGTGEAYRHALFGKWHLNHRSARDKSGAPVGRDVVREQGYGHFEGVIHNILEPDSYFDWPKVTNGKRTRSQVYATTATVDDFLAWEAAAEGPYFAVLSFNAPHTPLHAPPKELYSRELPPELSVDAYPRQHYFAMVEALDSELGRLFESLGPALDETTIIFMGDNGTPEEILKADPHSTLDEDHGKGSVYEGGVNVPLYIAGPRVLVPGSECTALVHAVDIFATVAELAGVELSDPDVYPVDRTLDSLSLVPFLVDPTRETLRRFNLTEKFFENTPEGAQPDKSQVAEGVLCQETVEPAPEGSRLNLSLCGGALHEQARKPATLELLGAVPNAEVHLFAGGYKPIRSPAHGDQLLAISKPFSNFITSRQRLDLSLPMRADVYGEFAITEVVHQRGNPSDFYLQAAAFDPLAETWSVSNALRVNQTINSKAIVSAEGYKLIVYPGAGHFELYNLIKDPRERRDLLSAERRRLPAKGKAALLELRQALDALLASER